jgi:O-antigen biosynthesis protein WbqP
MKRLIDFCLAFTALIIFSPIILVLILGVYIDSGLPTIFKQKRVGKNGKIFRCYKLRTMPQDTANLPSHQLTQSNISNFGRLARKLKLDELPQLANVLIGQMSLVGPRPCLPQQDELLILRQQNGILNLRPGITGLAQIRGIDMSDPIKLVACETEYLKNANLASDLKILFATIIGEGLHKDAIQKKK